MKTTITAIATLLLVASIGSYAYAETPAWIKNNAGWWADGTISEAEFLSGVEFLIADGIISVPVTAVSGDASQGVPAWVKNNAGWWADGTISEIEFLSGIEFLIADGIINVPATAVSGDASQGVPTWVKNNAGWWADGTISDSDFLGGIQHLVAAGLISVKSSDESMTSETVESASSDNPELAKLQAELEACSEITKAYKRLDCEKAVEKQIDLISYKTDATAFNVGPITYYWKGLNSDGNEFEISPTGQPILSLRMLAENNSSGIQSLNCTSPQICSYDVWDGSKAFKYSGMDFTSGQIVLNPGDSREFNMLFGPNIGYGGTEFEYDSSKAYHFRINEGFGSADILINLSDFD